MIGHARRRSVTLILSIVSVCAMFKGFRDFLMRGNVVDLAVAVVVGGAFGKVVEAFATDFIGSILGKFGGTPDFNTVAPGGIKIGSTITALIYFVIVAAVVYFMAVVPMNRLATMRRRPATEPEAAAVPEDVALLAEIRDLLADRPTV
jgi:large conductance mechanosensitive channel